MNGFFAALFRDLLLAVIGVFLAALSGGCAPQTTEIERGFNRLADAVESWGDKAIDETSTRTASLEGGAHLIHPGYRMDLMGFFGTGVIIQSDIRLRGVAGQLTGHAQADAGQPGTVPPPAARRKETAGPPAGTAETPFPDRV